MWILICISFVSVTVAEYAVVLFIMRQHRRRTQRKTLAVKSLVLQVKGTFTAAVAVCGFRKTHTLCHSYDLLLKGCIVKPHHAYRVAT